MKNKMFWRNLGSGLLAFARYLASGQIIVDTVRCLVGWGGMVAEGTFLLATVYVTINNVAHQLVTWILPTNVINFLNQLSVIAFSVLPELIIFAAVKITFDHWCMVKKSHRKDALLWAICYSLPTGIFLIMTVVTLASFVSVESTQAVSPQATGLALVVRCLAGWSYSMLQMLFTKIGQRGYADFFEEQESVIVALKSDISTFLSGITILKSDITALQNDNDTLRNELIEARLALAGKKVSRPMPVIVESEPVVTDKRLILKEHLQSAIMKGEKLNIKQISAKAGVSYGMARKHADTIIEEIRAETPRIALVREA